MSDYATRERRYLERLFPWIARNAVARLVADSRYAYLVATGARAERETLREAVEWAGYRLGLIR